MKGRDPMRKKRNVRRNEVEGFYIEVIAASAFVSRREPDRRYPDGASSTYISIEGKLETPITGRTQALISIHEEDGDGGLGAAIGLSATHWQVVTHLAEPQFSHALTLAATGKLAYCYVAVRGLRRGIGPVVSAGFHAAPVPSLAGESPF